MAATMTIGGRATIAPAEFDVVNPATGEPFTTAPECSREQLDEAFETAANAFRAWRQDADARCDALLRAAAAVEAAADDIAPVLTSEQGKPLEEARGEAHGVAATLEYNARLRLEPEVLLDDDAARIVLARRPVGVVAAITAWNYPLSLAALKIGPALTVGNTIVLKPSPFTPVSTLMLGEVLRDVLPPGVVNIVSGGDELGAWMTSHPVPRKVTFTGSVATGKRVAVAAAPDLKRVTLELGGNDPAIILDDADPDAIADSLFWGAFLCNGQICSAVKRVYAPVNRYDAVVDALADRARAVKVGNGADAGTQLGPLNNRPQYERVIDLVDDALAAGATAVAGGQKIAGGGYFFEPTILTGIEEGVRIVDEEQFGPALPVIPYTDLDDAIERANATHFGLGGSVWGTDVDRAADIAARLESGTAWVNQHIAVDPYQPFGGRKWSGIGVENGPLGLALYTDVQVLRTAKR